MPTTFTGTAPFRRGQRTSSGVKEVTISPGAPDPALAVFGSLIKTDPVTSLSGGVSTAVVRSSLASFYPAVPDSGFLTVTSGVSLRGFIIREAPLSVGTLTVDVQSEILLVSFDFDIEEWVTVRYAQDTRTGIVELARPGPQSNNPPGWNGEVYGFTVSTQLVPHMMVVVQTSIVQTMLVGRGSGGRAELGIEGTLLFQHGFSFP